MISAVFILAAGDAERHNGGNKPLIEIDGQTLLARMAQQVQNLSAEAIAKRIVVTHRDDLIEPSMKAACMVRGPVSRDFIASTLLSMKPEWEDRNIVLLGDVFYTDEVMREILAENRPLTFWGDNSDIFAIVFTKERELGKPLATFVDEARAHPRQFANGKLGGFFQFVPLPKSFMRVTDTTQDFDSSQDVERFKRGEFKHRQ